MIWPINWETYDNEILIFLWIYAQTAGYLVIDELLIKWTMQEKKKSFLFTRGMYLSFTRCMYLLEKFWKFDLCTCEKRVLHTHTQKNSQIPSNKFFTSLSRIDTVPKENQFSTKDNFANLHPFSFISFLDNQCFNCL